MNTKHKQANDRDTQRVNNVLKARKCKLINFPKSRVVFKLVPKFSSLVFLLYDNLIIWL